MITPTYDEEGTIQFPSDATDADIFEWRLLNDHLDPYRPRSQPYRGPDAEGDDNFDPWSNYRQYLDYYQNSRPAGSVPTIKDALFDFEKEYFNHYGEPLNRPWTKDANSIAAGNSIINQYHRNLAEYNAAHGTNYQPTVTNISQLPISSFAASDPTEHMGSGGVLGQLGSLAMDLGKNFVLPSAGVYGAVSGLSGLSNMLTGTPTMGSTFAADTAARTAADVFSPSFSAGDVLGTGLSNAAPTTLSGAINNVFDTSNMAGFQSLPGTVNDLGLQSLSSAGNLTVPPENYWNMRADSGATSLDAGTDYGPSTTENQTPAGYTNPPGYDLTGPPVPDGYTNPPGYDLTGPPVPDGYTNPPGYDLTGPPASAAGSSSGTSSGTPGASTGTPLSRILGGNATPEDWLSVGGTAGSTLLSLLGQNAQTDALKDVYNQTRTDRAPALTAFNNALANPDTFYNSAPALGATEAAMRKLSIGGNPANNPGDISKLAAYNLGGYNNYLNTLAGPAFGGQATQASLGSTLASQQASPYNTIGLGLSDLLNPQPKNNGLMDLLSQLKLGNFNSLV